MARRWATRWWTPALAAALLLGAGAAQAQLFADTEARKAIAELRQVYEQQIAADAARAAEADAQNAALAEQLAQLRKTMAELAAELSRAREELQALRLRREALAAQLPGIGQLGQSLHEALSTRLQRLEPLLISLDGDEFSASAAETQRFDEALALLRASNFDAASSALSKFLRRFPASGYADAARYWLGNALYGARNYGEALAVLRDFAAQAPSHLHAPSAWLAVSNAHLELKNPGAARRALEELIKLYPDSEAATEARERLATAR